jgi:hypothetical protein
MPYQDEEDDDVGTEPAHVSEAQSTRSDVAPSRGPASSAVGRSGWAIYCRTSVDPADPVWGFAVQQARCEEYAKAAGPDFRPVPGTCVFYDQCGASAPLDGRPGLAALLASGAAGILCLDSLRLSDGSGDPAGWLAAHGLGFCAVLADR